ncbi:glycine receptor subunit alpha-2-like [Ruditapes philippinarum]|uniref:glycine receptor subunit alpha-2-like n=1 Tax=Ruditapes philippinarum TaxID=129788 RepID=UPI00295A98C0|nr:glycine receptor subunit alpha-2-like [Ruditapes philippinarum]
MDRTAILLTIVFLFVKCLPGQSVTRREILNNLTMSSEYDAGYPADYDKPMPSNVIVQLEISDVTSINEQRMEYSLMMFLRMQWVDSRLAFNDSANFTRIELTGNMVNLIWTPDVYISNEREVDARSLVKHEKLAYIDCHGLVSFSMRISLTGYCHMDLTKYPFDEQTCNVRLQSYAFTSDKLILQWSEYSVLTKDYKLTNYDVHLGSQSEGIEGTDKRSLAAGQFSFLTISILFERKSQAYGSMYFAPFPIYVVISLCSIWLRKEIGSCIALCTGGIMATVLQWIAVYSRLPPVWYFTYLDGWILGNLVCICVILIINVILHLCGPKVCLLFTRHV